MQHVTQHVTHTDRTDGAAALQHYLKGDERNPNVMSCIFVKLSINFISFFPLFTCETKSHSKLGVRKLLKSPCFHGNSLAFSSAVLHD